MDSYRGDPLVLHVVGLRSLPSVPTVSRMLGECGQDGLDSLGTLCRDLVLLRLAQEGVPRVTLDFDGSVLSTGKRAEGAAVGFNKKKKGARSYYPLFCTVAQTGQIFDHLHRSGDVHDSNGAAEFIERCVAEVRAALPDVTIEVRMDSAFFSEAIVGLLGELGVEFTISVPFERFPELKGKIEERRLWWPTPGARSKGTGHFELRWKPKSWAGRERFLVVRTRARVQRKGPVQLDLFEPADETYDFKVVVTNKGCRAGTVVRFHEGRGYQERVFGELKSQLQADYVPARRRAANQAFLICALLAHNLGREIQMRAHGSERRRTTQSRTALWAFEEIATIRRTLIQRAGRLTRPAGKLTLTLAPNPVVERTFQRLMAA